MTEIELMITTGGIVGLFIGVLILKAHRAKAETIESLQNEIKWLRGRAEMEQEMRDEVRDLARRVYTLWEERQ